MTVTSRGSHSHHLAKGTNRPEDEHLPEEQTRTGQATAARQNRPREMAFASGQGTVLQR